MIACFQRDSMRLYRRIFCVLSIVAISISFSLLLSCRVTVEGEPHGPGGRPAHLSRIEGPWFFSANNFPGRLEFQWAGNVWAGRMLFNNIGQWEELTDVFFDPRSGQIQFRRPALNQVYGGTLSGGRIVGTFGFGAPGTFPWEAWRQ